MKYRITVRVEIDIHPLDREEHTINDLMNAFREGLRQNPRTASRVEGLRLSECRLIEPEMVNAEPVKMQMDRSLNKRGEK